MKVAVVVLADIETHSDLGRVVNAMVTTKECKEAGDDVQLVFDGAGTQWPGLLADESHEAHRLYDAVADTIAGACGYCAGAFGAKESLHHARVNLLDEYHGHPSLRKLMAEGRHVLTF